MRRELPLDEPAECDELETQAVEGVHRREEHAPGLPQAHGWRADLPLEARGERFERLVAAPERLLRGGDIPEAASENVGLAVYAGQLPRGR